MKKSKIISLALTVVLLLGVIVGASLSASAETTVTDSDWLEKPEKTLVKCPGGSCDHKSCDYVYSFAVIGDTQNINIGDVENKTAYTKGIYEWILKNKDSKNISYVMGVGDITQAYYKGYSSGIWEKEWANAKDALSVLDGKLGYSLVRGNHDITDGFNGTFGKTETATAAYYKALADLAATNDSAGRPMAGFLDEKRIEDTYRKIVVGGHKYIIFTLDWHPTEACLVWLDEILAANSDYEAIITLHSFITRDGTITDDYEDTFPYENLTGARPNWEEVSASGGNVHPKVLWQSVLSKHANVKLVFAGHIDEDNIIVNQMVGEKGNTVTSMLIDGQTIDSDFIDAGKDPVGLVAMLYFSADGDVVNVEYISSVRANKGQNAYLRAENQFTLDLDYSTEGGESGWTKTPHGSVRTDIYNAYPFHILMDDDSDESTDAFHFGSYASWQETLKAIHDFAGNTRPSSQKKMKTYYIVMSRNVTDSYSGNHDNRAGGNFGKTVLDLNGNTLTLACSGSSTAFLPIYVNSADKYPRFDIINGNINIQEKVNFIVGQAGTSAQGQTGTINLRDLNITYTPTEGGGAFGSLISWYSGSGTGSNYDVTLENCNIDYSAISSAHTLFNLNDTNNNCLYDITVKGGSIKGGTAANTTLFATNGVYDKVTFAKDKNGNYTALTLSDSGKIAGVYYNEEGKTVEYGNPTVSGDAYSYSFVNSTYELTEYGIIDTTAYPASSYPFALFKGGEMLLASSDWNTLINTNFKSTANYQSGCTLLLRRDYNTSESSSSPSWFARIDDLTIDLGDHVLTRSTYHFLQFMGTESTAHSTYIRVINGTVASGSDTAPVVFNNADTNTNADKVDVVFDGVTFDLSASVKNEQGIVSAFGDGIEKGIDATVTLNDCTVYRGASTRKMTLFNLVDEKTGNVINKIDVDVVINGGVIESDSMSGITLAKYSPAREGMASSADTLTFGKGSDGRYPMVKLPEGAGIPGISYALTSGNHYLVKSHTANSKDYYTFVNVTTPFGDVDTKYIDAQKYPFALFLKGANGYTFDTVYATFSAAINAAKTKAPNVGDEAYIAMRRDYDSTGTESTTVRDAKCKITIDLGGYMLSSTATKHMFDIHMDYTKYADNANYTSTLVFQNGSIQNNRSGSSGLITLGHGGTNSVAKRFEFIFNNVTFAHKSNPVIQSWNHTATTGLDVKVELNGCTFDFSEATEKKPVFAFAGSQPYTNVNITLDGCGVIASNFSKYYICTKGDDDSVTFIPDDNGVYLTVVQTEKSTPALNFVPANASNLGFTTIPNSDGNYAYALVAKDADLDYTIKIPEAYKDASLYPVIIFKNGEYLANSTGIYSAYTETVLAALKESADNEVVILLRKDITESNTGSIGTYELKGKLIIDLGGYTYTSKAKSFFAGTAKAYSKYPNNPRIEVRNGTFNTIRLLQPYTQDNGYCIQYDFTFKNVTIGRTSGYWASLVSTQVGKEYAGYSLLNLTFDNCTIDLRTNEKSSGAYTLFDLALDADNQVTNVVFKGGEIIFGRDVTFATINSGYGDNTGFPAGAPDHDVIRFEKGKEGYTKFTYKASGTVITNTYDNPELTFVNISDNGTDVQYRLVEKAAAEQNFTPKMSLTLDRELILNVYIPMHAHLTAAKLDGEALDLEALEVKDGYYVKRIPLAAKEAARDIKLEVTLTVDGKDMRGTFTFSTVKYAEKLLGDNGISEAEKTLVRDVLAYIRAAYAYFGTNDAEKIAKINTLIGEDYSNAPTAEGSATAEASGMKSVTFVLDGTPAMRFYLADGADASKYAFFIGGTRVKTETSADGKYIDIDVYAYALCETVTYTIDGAESGSFHINAYYTYVSGDSYTGADKAELVTLTECFWRYLQSAREYRNSVTEG